MATWVWYHRAGAASSVCGARAGECLLQCFGVVLLVVDVHRSCGEAGGVESDVGGSGGRQVGKGGRGRTERVCWQRRNRGEMIKGGLAVRWMTGG